MTDLFNPNLATQLLAKLGVYKAFGIQRQYRYATPEREVHGKRAGGFSRGLHNAITRKQLARNAAANQSPVSPP